MLMYYMRAAIGGTAIGMTYLTGNSTWCVLYVACVVLVTHVMRVPQEHGE